MGFFTQKKVWHSFLKARSPLVVKFSNGPLESNYAGADPIIYFTVRGCEDEDYYYNIEQDDIYKVLENVPKGEWFQVTAGGASDTQYLEIKPAGDETNSQGALDYSPRTDKQTSAAPVRNFSTGTISGDYQKCLGEAIGIANSMLDNPHNEIYHAIASTMFIQWHYTNHQKPLNVDDVSYPDEPMDDKHNEYVGEIRGLLSQLHLESGKSHDGKNIKTALKKINEAMEDDINEELFGRISGWLDKEISYQAPSLPEEDDLPF